METKAIDQVLAQLRAAREMAAGQLQNRSQAPKPAAGVNFGAVLKDSIDGVNSAQQDALKRAEAFEMGAPGASLHDAMISMQKASISFQAAVQVRNKVVAAYQEIMNMQV
jgi:flagellar hook-basal body complex protein FliE